MITKKLLLCIGLLIVDSVFFGFTNPTREAPIVVIVGFMLLLLNVYWFFRGAQMLAGFYTSWFVGRKHICTTLTTVVGIVLALQSIGQLTTHDFILLPLAGMVMYAYSAYVKKQPEGSNRRKLQS